jgi:hypothetical protein
MLAAGNSVEAAIFNLIKACFSLIAQCVTFARRAEYRRALASIAASSSARTWVHQRYSLFVGSCAIAAGFVFLLTNSSRLELPVAALFLALIQAAIWLLLSAFFHARILRGRNAPQSFYALVTSSFVIFAVALISVETAMAGIYIEIIASLCAFSVYMFVGRIRARA